MSLASMATASHEPMPGSFTVVSPTVIASEATTKNQPPDIDIMVFQISPGMANGSSIFQNFCQPESLKTKDASSISRGIVVSDWYRLKVMFHACEVKIAKMAAHSTPMMLPGNKAIKP